MIKKKVFKLSSICIRYYILSGIIPKLHYGNIECGAIVHSVTKFVGRRTLRESYILIWYFELDIKVEDRVLRLELCQCSLSDTNIPSRWVYVLWSKSPVKLGDRR